jgi:hypothetical protein
VLHQGVGGGAKARDVGKEADGLQVTAACALRALFQDEMGHEIAHRFSSSVINRCTSIHQGTCNLRNSHKVFVVVFFSGGLVIEGGPLFDLLCKSGRNKFEPGSFSLTTNRPR